MEIEISTKGRAKALFDAGTTTAIGIARGAGVSERTAYGIQKNSRKESVKKGNLIRREKNPKEHLRQFRKCFKGPKIGEGSGQAEAQLLLWGSAIKQLLQ